MNKIEIICTVIATTITVSSTVLAGIWYMLKKAGRDAVNDKRLNDVETKANDLPCINHHSDITAIKSILIQKYPNAANVFSMKASPRKLNSIGEKVYDDINGKLFLLENKNKLFEYIDKNSPLKPLDVEQYAYASLLYYTGTDIFNNIKDYVYNAKSIIKEDGERYDIALNDVCYVLSIPLRDMYLIEHPDIS